MGRRRRSTTSMARRARWCSAPSRTPRAASPRRARPTRTSPGRRRHAPWLSPPPPPPPPPPPGNTVSFHPITPGRLADTRADATPGPSLGSAAPLQVQVWGQRGSLRRDHSDAQPHGREPLGGGFLTAYPCTKPWTGHLEPRTCGRARSWPTRRHRRRRQRPDLRVLQVTTRRRRRRHGVVGARVGQRPTARSTHAAATTAGPDRRPPGATHVSRWCAGAARRPGQREAASLNLTVTGPVGSGFPHRLAVRPAAARSTSNLQLRAGSRPSPTSRRSTSRPTAPCASTT